MLDPKNFRKPDLPATPSTHLISLKGSPLDSPEAVLFLRRLIGLGDDEGSPFPHHPRDTSPIKSPSFRVDFSSDTEPLPVFRMSPAPLSGPLVQSAPLTPLVEEEIEEKPSSPIAEDISIADEPEATPNTNESPTSDTHGSSPESSFGQRNRGRRRSSIKPVFLASVMFSKKESPVEEKAESPTKINIEKTPNSQFVSELWLDALPAASPKIRASSPQSNLDAILETHDPAVISEVQSGENSVEPPTLKPSPKNSNNFDPNTFQVSILKGNPKESLAPLRIPRGSTFKTSSVVRRPRSGESDRNSDGASVAGAEIDDNSFYGDSSPISSERTSAFSSARSVLGPLPGLTPTPTKISTYFQRDESDSDSVSTSTFDLGTQTLPPLPLPPARRHLSKAQKIQIQSVREICDQMRETTAKLQGTLQTLIHKNATRPRRIETFDSSVKKIAKINLPYRIYDSRFL